MNFKFLTNEYDNIHELKKDWKALIVKLHPDAGGSNEDVITLNNEYDKLFGNLKANKTKDHKFHSMDDNYRQKVEAIIFCKGLIIELVGSWLWVSGDTLKHSAILRKNGFQWSTSRKMWYYRAGKYRSWHNKNATFRDIKNTYGCENFDTKEATPLAAKTKNEQKNKSKFDSKYKRVG